MRKPFAKATTISHWSLIYALYVAEDREQKSLDGFWGTLTEEQRAGAQAFSVVV
jgi:hypothetical protein